MNPRYTPLRYKIYVWIVFAAGMATLASVTWGMPEWDASIASGSYALLWAVMIVVAAVSPLPLPWGKGTANIVTALDIAALLLFGPAGACWVGVLSRLVANATQGWNPLLPGVLSLGKIVLALTASSYVYTRLGGVFGTALSVSAELALPLLAAIAVYLFIKGIFGGLAHAIAANSRRAPAVASWFETQLPGDLLVVPVGPLLALTQIYIGPVGVALFLLPLLLARYAFNLWIEAKGAHMHIVRILMAAVDAADPFTRDHSYRVSRMSTSLGRHFGLRPAALEELEFAALVHDIGRTAIQRDVLVKSGRLTEQEMLLLQVHPKIGADVVDGDSFFPQASEIVLSHHEQPNGAGYPRGIRDKAIPMESRIIMVVAAFDAMTSDRPYRRGLSAEEALEELLVHSGTQFFPEVVESLIHLFANGELFADFDEEHIERYRNGQEHSRAVEAYLSTHGTGSGVPVKSSGHGISGRRHSVALPMIELPSIEPESRRIEETIPLKAKGAWSLVVAGQTDVGCKRKNNEDSFAVFRFEDASRGCMLVVADGMGGAAAGEVASQLAVEQMIEEYGQWTKRGQPRDALSHAFRAANRSVHLKASGDSRLDGMGTTCTAAAIVGLGLTLGHVGDSRAYLVRDNSIEQLTEDHTLAGEMERVAGAHGAAIAQVSSHVLTRCIGAQPDVQVDLTPKPIQLDDGAMLILCSDGLSNVVESEDILDLVSANEPPDACSALIELARARGGPDNITVIVGRIRRD